jgi:solute carrier family 25 carnitine/acylcarnitine transporter 20/29
MRRHANSQASLQLLDLFIAGGLAGQAAWLVCYPQDVIKSRLQVDPVASGHGSVYYARQLWRENGRNWRVFFRGFGTTLIRAFPANAATFLVYEHLMAWMEKVRHAPLTESIRHPEHPEHIATLPL